jgi:hypothetical protein
LEERAPKLVSFEEFEGKRQSLLEEASAFIFHRQAPRGELSQKHAILVPKSGEAPYEADLEQNLRPSSWKELDPLLRYLQLADLEFPEAAIFRPQRADEILLSSRKGPLLLRRVSGKAEQILFGFDLFPYEASKSPVRSIFLLNLFSWLKEDSLGQSQSNLPYAQKSAGQARLLRGENDLLALSGEVNIREPGILFQDEESRALLLGFFSSQESNLEASLPIHYSSPETSSVAEESRQPLFSLLALLILGVFLADILLLLARPRRALLNRRSQQGVGS